MENLLLSIDRVILRNHTPSLQHCSDSGRWISWKRKNNWSIYGRESLRDAALWFRRQSWHLHIMGVKDWKRRAALMPGLTIMTNMTITGGNCCYCYKLMRRETAFLLVFFGDNLIILLLSFLLFNCKISSTHRRRGKAKRVCVCASSVT